MRQDFSRLQWWVWCGGIASSVVTLVAIGVDKGIPEGYLWVFYPAALYCLLAQVAGLFVGRRLEGQARGLWLGALATARVGFLALIAIAIVGSLLFLLRPER